MLVAVDANIIDTDEIVFEVVEVMAISVEADVVGKTVESTQEIKLNGLVQVRIYYVQI